jgi:hyperosmotically inducible periplasmic protein
MIRGVPSKLLLGTLLAAGALLASNADTGPPQRGAENLESRVRHQILMYPNYTLWDEVDLRVTGDKVELQGAVSQPYKKDDIERIVRSTPGVGAVSSEIRVLPLSPFDDRLRMAVARAIYGSPALSRYGMGALPSIHIVVENGRVTLSGVVDRSSDKDLAGLRAGSAGLSLGPIVNHLAVTPTPAKKG